jgi:hypothetical protein
LQQSFVDLECFILQSRGSEWLWNPQLTEVSIGPTGATITPFKSLLPGYKRVNGTKVSRQTKGAELVELGLSYLGDLLTEKSHVWHLSLHGVESLDGHWQPYESSKDLYDVKECRLRAPVKGPTRDDFKGEFLGTWGMFESAEKVVIEIEVKRRLALARVVKGRKLGVARKEFKPESWTPVYKRLIQIECGESPEQV